MTQALVDQEPTHVEKALQQDCWSKTMEVELDSIPRNSTWDLSLRPANRKVIVAPWWIPRQEYSSAYCKGYAQCPTIAYDDTFASTITTCKKKSLLNMLPNFYTSAPKGIKASYGLKQARVNGTKGLMVSSSTHASPILLPLLIPTFTKRIALLQSLWSMRMTWSSRAAMHHSSRSLKRLCNRNSKWHI